MTEDIRPRPINVLLLVLVLALAACTTARQNETASPDHGAAGHTTQSSAPFDQQFIDMMVPHHEGAVAMAKIAQTRAEHPELKQLADAIIREDNSLVRDLSREDLELLLG